MSTVLDVQVTEAKMLTPVIRELTLARGAGRLPGFSAGSHMYQIGANLLPKKERIQS